MKPIIIETEIDRKSIRKIPDKLLRQVLINVNMWDESDERDPAKDHMAAWSLTGKMTSEIEQGIRMHMGVTDAINGYGRLENWVADYQEYTETCRHCKTHPNHSGNHSWHREWPVKFSEEGFSFESAICRLAIRYTFEVG